MRRLVPLLLLVLAACLAPAGTVEPTPVPPTVEPTPTVRVLMLATDPATFVRAAGQPQLVEFFAFW